MSDMVKGGHGTLDILKKTHLSHPTKPNKIEVCSGMDFPVLAWEKIDDQYIKFTLEDKELDGLNTWLIAIDAAAIDTASPEDSKIVAPINLVPEKSRPSKWTPETVRANLSMSILPKGNFTWIEATHGGSRLPPDQATVDAMIKIATMAQPFRDKFGFPWIITSWYRPPAINRDQGGARLSRHIKGDAIDLRAEGMSGRQLYTLFDPVWPGGLGRYSHFPNIIHLDTHTRRRWP